MAKYIRNKVRFVLLTPNESLGVSTHSNCRVLIIASSQSFH